MFILNKKSICWRCDKEFIIDQHAAKMRKPKCGCGTKREILRTPEISDTALDDILKDIING
jgi:DNA-directed RNA polymerase subunit RPC12/RpoP